VRFEDLVGARGDGDDTAQCEAIKKIADFLGRNDVNIQQVAQAAFGVSETFRNGLIGAWHDIADSSFQKIVRQSLAGYLQLAGYAS
jgi:hypothetical protein